MVHDLELVISTLPEKEAMILRLRYGLVDGQERTLEEIGHFFNVGHPFDSETDGLLGHS